MPSRSSTSLKARLAKPGSASSRILTPRSCRLAMASARPCSESTNRARSSCLRVPRSNFSSSSKPWLGSLRRWGANSTVTGVCPTSARWAAPPPLARPKRLSLWPPGPSPHIRSNSATKLAARALLCSRSRWLTLPRLRLLPGSPLGSPPGSPWMHEGVKLADPVTTTARSTTMNLWCIRPLPALPSAVSSIRGTPARCRMATASPQPSAWSWWCRLRLCGAKPIGFSSDHGVL